MEEWRDISKLGGSYQVSNLGRVRSLTRRTPNRGGWQTRKGQILKPEKARNGYLRITLWTNGKPKHYLIHRLVAQTFLPNPHNFPQVNHKDENKLNNCISNLEWCSEKYNKNYGTFKKRVAKAKAKPVIQLDLNGKTIKIWSSTKECSKNNFVPSDVAKCCRGERKVHKGFMWRYAEAEQ